MHYLVLIGMLETQDTYLLDSSVNEFQEKAVLCEAPFLLLQYIRKHYYVSYYLSSLAIKTIEINCYFKL